MHNLKIAPVEMMRSWLENLKQDSYLLTVIISKSLDHMTINVMNSILEFGFTDEKQIIFNHHFNLHWCNDLPLLIQRRNEYFKSGSHANVFCFILNNEITYALLDKIISTPENSRCEKDVEFLKSYQKLLILRIRTCIEIFYPSDRKSNFKNQWPEEEDEVSKDSEEPGDEDAKTK